MVNIIIINNNYNSYRFR